MRIRRIVFRLRLSFSRLIFYEGGEKRTTAKNKSPKFFFEDVERLYYEGADMSKKQPVTHEVHRDKEPAINKLFKVLVKAGGSDLHLKVGLVP